MVTMLDKVLEGKESQAINVIKAPMRFKPGGVVIGELRNTEAAALLLEQNNNAC